MARLMATLFVLFLAGGSSALRAADAADLQALLGRTIIGPRQALIEVQDYTEARVPKLPTFASVAEWEKYASRLRADLLDQVVFRGKAAVWRDAKTRVEWLDTIAGGPGYRIKKLRFEALPGLWIPALLYEPEKLAGKVPVYLAVNGHDPIGKSAPYKQIRCINLVKRGIVVLNVEWLFMGQLRTDNYAHYRMNQLDLCGTSGLAPFYLSMKRSLDILLAHPNADPARVAVSGLSGGGWQTIMISALDPRVTLANPVAGYGGFRTAARFLDVGDSEQSPCFMGTLADYTHLTALMAPRPLLLTYNSKDDCCFKAGHALPPLLEAARPIYKLYGKENALRSHVNDDPGTHNYEKDNRQAFYRMIGDHFFAGQRDYHAAEIPCDGEVKTKDELMVPMPERNKDFHSLTLGLGTPLPREPTWPGDAATARKWQRAQTDRLREVVKFRDYEVKAAKAGSEDRPGLRATFWKLRMGDAWTVPAVELVRGTPKGTTIVLADGGRGGAAATAERLLTAGQRVLALDPFYIGESKIEKRDCPFALLVATLGDRPLGLQAGQVAAAARWSLREHNGGPVTIVTEGSRTSTIALVSAALEEKAIGRLELRGSLGTLKELIEQNRSMNDMPELFCFGLLEVLDIRQIAALVAPRPVVFVGASERAKHELGGLGGWYTLLGSKFDPLP
jgi:hypothetical protein